MIALSAGERRGPRTTGLDDGSVSPRRNGRLSPPTVYREDRLRPKRRIAFRLPESACVGKNRLWARRRLSGRPSAPYLTESFSEPVGCCRSICRGCGTSARHRRCRRRAGWQGGLCGFRLGARGSVRGPTARADASGLGPGNRGRGGLGQPIPGSGTQQDGDKPPGRIRDGVSDGRSQGRMHLLGGRGGFGAAGVPASSGGRSQQGRRSQSEQRAEVRNGHAESPAFGVGRVIQGADISRMSNRNPPGVGADNFAAELERKRKG